jgi:hypothetical protein
MTNIEFYTECKRLWKSYNYPMSKYRLISKALYMLSDIPVLNKSNNKIEKINNHKNALEWFNKILNNKDLLTDNFLKTLYKNVVINRNSLKKGLNELKWQNERLSDQQKALNLFKTDIEYIVSNGIFRNGILVNIDNDQHKKYIGVQILNNRRLNDYFANPFYYSFGSKNNKTINIVEYRKNRYNSFKFECNLIQYPQPLKIYLNSYTWDCIENSFMECFSYYVYNNVKNNNPESLSLRKISNVFENIDSLLNPESTSQRSKHGSVVIYSQNLFKLNSLYKKTNKEFQECIIDLLDFYNIDQQLFFDVINNS